MKIAIGSDHAGYAVKEAVIAMLTDLGHEVADLGAYNAEPSDYPVFAEKVAVSVAKRQAERGIVICGNGIGMAIVANKIPGIRAALVTSEKGAHDTRDHNDSNVLSLAGRDLSVETNLKLVKIWIETPFSGVDRHQRRVNEISRIEEEYEKQMFLK
jgi:ribose 5-phosphate isomerase B